MSKPVVSVIIPTYNRAPFILAAVQSALGQKNVGGQIEVIVIDNGSTDDTEARLKSVSEDIRYIKISASGRPSIPRNIGIREAKADLIAFLDSDDLWMPDKLEGQLEVMNDLEVLLCYGNAEVITAGGTRTGEMVIPREMGKSGYIFNDLVATNFVSTLTVITRRDGLIAAGGFNEAPGLVEDWELWLRLSRTGKFHYIDSPIALYRRHDATISFALNDGTNQYALLVYRTILRQPLGRAEKAAVHRGIAAVFSARMRNTGGLTAYSLLNVVYERFLAKLLAVFASSRIQKRHPR